MLVNVIIEVEMQTEVQVVAVIGKFGYQLFIVSVVRYSYGRKSLARFLF